MNKLNIAELATGIIKDFEGFRADAYPDPRTGDEPWTIGYGTTVYANGTKVKRGDKVTEQKASIELIQKVAKLMTELEQVILVPLTDGQMACMVSFAYNMGVSGSGLQIARLNKGLVDEFKRKHLEYVNKGSNVEAGLRRRRKAELELFETGDTMKPTWINLVRHMVKEAPEYRAYLMNKGDCIEVKTFKTREDLLAILRSNEAGNVAVGTEGWDILPSVPTEVVATLTSKGFRRDHMLDLELDIGGNKFSVISGQPGAQNLRKPQDPRSVPGCMEPIPQGTYKIGSIDWAGGSDNYTKVWSTGLGPVWVPLTATFSDDRGSFGFHVDGGVLGSAGCVVVPNLTELKRLVTVLHKYDPKTLIVDWGL